MTAYFMITIITITGIMIIITTITITCIIGVQFLSNPKP